MAGKNQTQTIGKVVIGPDGAIWVGTGGGGLARFDGQAWTTYVDADVVYENLTSIAIEETIGWVGISTTVVILDDGYAYVVDRGSYDLVRFPVTDEERDRLAQILRQRRFFLPQQRPSGFIFDADTYGLCVSAHGAHNAEGWYGVGSSADAFPQDLWDEFELLMAANEGLGEQVSVAQLVAESGSRYCSDACVRYYMWGYGTKADCDN
jgi:hypothetical protein